MKFVLLLVGIVLFPDLYIWNFFIKGNHIGWNLLWFIPLALIIISLISGFIGGVAQTFFMRMFFALLLCTALPKLVFTLFSVSGKGIGLLLPHSQGIANTAGLVLAVITLGCALYGFLYGWKQLTVKEVTVQSSRLPESFNGYRIVQLSDLHIGTYLSSPETVDKLVDKVNQLQPDLIVFTGDLVNLIPDEVVPFQQMLSRLQAADGVYSILGNHDYCVYNRNDDTRIMHQHALELRQRERDMGWHLLLNENRLLRRGTDSIALIGVENDGTPPFPAYADLNKAMQGLTDEHYKILLSHDPTHWRRSILQETNIDLTLSGHTHSMQLRIGRFSPSMLTHEEWAGLYSSGPQLLYINSGTGSNVPFRFGAWPEITLLTLSRF